MKIFESFAEFINEGKLDTKEINIDEFPNPITKKLKDIFLKKGKMDGDENDDKIKTFSFTTEAKNLKPSQNKISMATALEIATTKPAGGDLGTMISKDNYIIDGHHGWASTMLTNPNAKLTGIKVDLNLGDLIPVLRTLGDALGNKRGKNIANNINIFNITFDDIKNAVEKGKNIKSKYNKIIFDKWLKSIGGLDSLKKNLKLIQDNPPPKDALPRNEMPRIRHSLGDDKKAAKLIANGDIDIKKPYA